MSKKENNNEETKVLSFEEKIENAKKLLEKLIDPQITLSNSVDIYKNGMNELKEAQELLDNAKLEFEELKKP
ncbi:MAG: exodeoxyribonuclease VII small subunit [Arcobacteraceae bacterium]